MADPGIQVFVQLRGEDVPAGRLFPHRRGKAESATFHYFSSYLARQDSYELDPALPLVSGALQTPAGRKIFGAFSDCAPDGWGRMLIARRRRKAEGNIAIESYSEADYLLGARDDLRQGALRFKASEDGDFLAIDEEGVPDLLELPELLNLAARAEADAATGEELEILRRGGSSLGGARPKVHVRDQDGRISIAKFPRPEKDRWNVAAWEGVALSLARRAGVVVPDSELREIDGRSVLIVRRFDRSGELRVGYVSAMTMLEAGEMEPRSYLEIVDVIEQSSARGTEDIRELWRRIAFTILIRNTDDHLRNHGFLRTSTSGWALSPAFDVNPDPEPGNNLLSTSVDGSSDEASLVLLLENAELFRLQEKEALKILAEVSKATSAWRDVAAVAGLDPRETSRMEAAFEHDSASFARRLREDGD
jgi:serine/threonine-protein kinase HipA